VNILQLNSPHATSVFHVIGMFPARNPRPAMRKMTINKHLRGRAPQGSIKPVGYPREGPSHETLLKSFPRVMFSDHDIQKVSLHV
jgi:hypothetical protein